MTSSFKILCDIRLILLGLSILVASCVSPYDAQSHKQLTDLKAFHEKLLDDYTIGSKVDYNKKEANGKIQEGELLFRQAKEFSLTTGSETRTKNFEYLHELFLDDAEVLNSKKQKLSKVLVGEYKKLNNFAYDKAIEGEIARPEGPE